jgi:hypothetical protein
VKFSAIHTSLNAAFLKTSAAAINVAQKGMFVVMAFVVKMGVWGLNALQLRLDF